MRLIVAGGRNYANRTYLFHLLDVVAGTGSGCLQLLHGGCTGADAIAEEWAVHNRVATRVFPADWDKFGKAAGPMRNRLMAQHADVLLAVPGGAGTRNMISEAKKAGLVVYESGLDDPSC